MIERIRPAPSDTEVNMSIAASSLFTMAFKKPSARHQRPSIEEYASELQQNCRLTAVVREAVEKAHRVRREHQMVFYIAGALTGMSEEVKGRYGLLSDTIADRSAREMKMFGYAPHLHGTDPVKHPDVKPREVRDIDFLWAAVMPNAHINLLTPVAHGNAVEAGWAEMYGIPSLHIVEEGFTASRLIRGMDKIVGTVIYRDFAADALPQVGMLLNGVDEINNRGGELYPSAAPLPTNG